MTYRSLALDGGHYRGGHPESCRKIYFSSSAFAAVG